MPQRELIKLPGIEVVGSLISSKETGEQIAQNLAGFDQTMKSLGLKIPPLTKVVVSDRTLLPKSGPLANQTNISNLWHKSEADNIILMQPFFYHRPTVTNPMVLFHERTHSILKGMYRKNSYASLNRPTQEGLADFLPSHYTGNPVINLPMGLSRNADKAPPLPLSTIIGSHNAGKVFSYTLWKLRERMGEEEVNALLKPFIDGLGQYYESFEKQHDYGKIEGLLEKVFSPNYEYFMAVLKKTLQEEKGETQAVDGFLSEIVFGFFRKYGEYQRAQFVDEIASELGLDIAVIDDIAASITKSDKNFSNTSTDKKVTHSLSHFLGTAAIATEIYLGYLGYRYFFGQKD